jgi:glycosyltransferase involved in cell wall biosynthesis
MPSILFVSHSVGRTGAPILLLHLLRWLRQNTQWDLDVVVPATGALLPEFQEVCSTRVLNLDQPKWWRRLRYLAWKAGIPGGARTPESMWRGLVPERQRRSVDLIYGNSAPICLELAALAASGRPAILHLHEMRNGIRLYSGEQKLRQALPAMARVIAASAAVGDQLRTDFGLPAERLNVVHEFVPGEAAPAAIRAGWRQAVRKELGVAEDTVLIGACGTLEWRKGPDLFLQIASLARKRVGQRALHFLWLGGDPTGGLREADLRADLRLLGMEAQVTLVGERPDPARYLAALDLFLLTSREDPFPLGMLEAAAMGLPILCFAGSGGGPEFVESDAGWVAPYLDTGAMAEGVVALATDDVRRSRVGEAAARKVRERFTINVQAPRIAAIMEEVMAQHPRSG